MRLSALQRSILRECYQYPKRRVPRQPFIAFYKKTAAGAKVIDNITVSLERLIDRGFLIGFGRRTPCKWFIEEVKLTPLGRRIAKQSFGKQQQLPLK
ncbi:MAG: hypothetical protein AAB619_00830 [Patescibacteria group bacterium]